MAFKKTDDGKIALIKKLRAGGLSHDEIAERVGISKHTAIKYSSDVMPANEEEITNSIEGDAMGKMKLDLNKILNKAATEAVEAVVERQMEPFDDAPVLEPSVPSPISQFFGEGTVSNTITIYKVIAGTPRFIGTINQELWSTWSDFEISFRDHIQKMTLETRDLINYANGSYLLKSGGRSRAIELGALHLPEKPVTVVKPVSATEQMNDVVSLIKAINESLPRNSDNSDIYKLMLENKNQELMLLREELKAAREKDVLAEITKSLDLARMVNGDSSSPWITALQTFGPQIASAVERIAGALAVGRAMPPVAPHLALKANPTAPALPLHYQNLFNELYTIIKAHDSGKFPEISRKIVSVFGGDDSIIRSIASGETTQAQLIDLLKMYGGAPYQEAIFQEALTRFVEAYTKWTKSVYPQSQPTPPIQPQVQPIPSSDNKPASAPNNTITVCCPQCHAVYDVDKNDWQVDDKVCGNRLLNGECTGILEEVKLPEA